MSKLISISDNWIDNSLDDSIDTKTRGGRSRFSRLLVRINTFMPPKKNEMVQSASDHAIKNDVCDALQPALNKLPYAQGIEHQLDMKELLIILFLSMASVASAGRLHPERYYQELYAEQVGGQMEVTAPDGSRVDILTDELAIELDFADKLFEAVGQSLNYGFQFNRKPAILLIMEHKEDERHFIRLGSLILHYGLEIELIPLRVYIQ